MRVIDKYLAQYAYPSPWITKVETLWDHAVAVPIKDEVPALASLLESLTLAARHRAPERSLLILVLNGPFSATNAACFEQWFNPARAFSPSVSLSALDTSLDLLFVDGRSEDDRLLKEGVGRARKLGCDIALALHATNKVRSPWIATTDADAYVPTSYFSLPKSSAAALLFDYTHGPQPDLAHRLYEGFLRYYVEGLRYAGSPYAFHALGSTIVVSAETYARVRGFPRREAAEDFYLLNKVAKEGEVVVLSDCIRLQPRDSHRVPFGTGVGTFKIRALLDENLGYRMYDPRCFSELKRFLEAVEEVWQDEPERIASLAPFAYRWFTSQGGVAALATILSERQQLQSRQRAFRVWMDSFRTLKLMHYLRDEVWPNLSWETALAEAPFEVPGWLENSHHPRSVPPHFFEVGLSS